MKRLLIWTGVFIGIIMIIMFLGYIILSSLFDPTPYVDNNSYVVINIGGFLPEYQPADFIEEYYLGISLDMRRLRKTIKMAALDERIKGIVMNVGFVGMGFAKINELQDLILEYKKSGKRIIAYLKIGLMRDYYLASVCDSIFLQPEGTLLLTGMAAEVTYYKGLLNQIGIEADFEHVGRYKTYPEPYTSDSMSDELREVINDILDFRFDTMVAKIGEFRDLEGDSLIYMINTISGFTPQEALKFDLIDGIKHKDEIEKSIVDEDMELRKISALEYSMVPISDIGITGGPRFAVIYCTGSIMGGEDRSDPVFGSTMGASRVVRDLNNAAQNKSIKAIILRIDSPGGSGLASEEIWYAINEAGKEKPVIASISDVGASGGYYIAIAADTIVAHSSSLIGSIGVFAGKFSVKGLYDLLKLRTINIKRGENANLFSLQSKFSESERKIIRKIIEEHYLTFVTKVAAARNKSIEEVKNIAQGRVWNGAEGYSFGLVDTLGGLDVAINIAKEMIGIDQSQNIRLTYYPKRKSLFQSLMTTFQFTENPIKKLEYYIEQLQAQPLALMPYYIKFR